ncbi:MAG: hypothetical protein Q7R72_01560 [bacterium]|nr:hypothetical protein [bacterium]
MTLDPDPWLAPDVPPPFIMEAYVYDGFSHLNGKLDPEILQDLADQIEGSENCARAYGLVKGFKDKAGKPMEESDILRLKELLEIQDPVSFEVGTLGQIFRTRRRVKSGANLRSRWTFAPPAVIVTAVRLEAVDGTKTLLRGVVCTPLVVSCDAPNTSDEIVVTDLKGDLWIAHLSEEFPIHVEQLGKSLTGVSADDLLQVQAGLVSLEGGDLEEESSDELDPFEELDRAILHDEASWLASTAYAYLARTETATTK